MNQQRWDGGKVHEMGSNERCLILPGEHFLEPVGGEIDVLHVEEGSIPTVQHFHIHRSWAEGVGQLTEALAIMRPLVEIVRKTFPKTRFDPSFHLV